MDYEKVPFSLSFKQLNEHCAENIYTISVFDYTSKNYTTSYNQFKSVKFLTLANSSLIKKYTLDHLSQISNLSQGDNSNLNTDNELKINNYKHKIQVYLLNIIFVLIATFGLITSFFLIYKYRTVKSNIFLGIFLFAISLALIELVLYWQDFYSYTPTVSIYRILFFLWAPSLFFYLKTKYTNTFLENKVIIFHYLPFFVVLISMIIFGNLHSSDKIDNNTFLYGLNIIMNDNWIKAIHLSAYLFLIIVDFQTRHKQLEQGFKNWIQTLIVFISILIIFIIARAGFEHIYAFDYISKYFIAVYLMLFITVLDILLIVQPNIVLGAINILQTDKPKYKYKNSSLTESMSLRVKGQILDSLNKDKIFLDNTLTLSKLAKKINVDKYSVSQVINQELDKNFYELINEYRIAEALKIIESKPNKQVLDLIYECGFNNKVSFYKAFKKKMHMTPKEYIETQTSKYKL